MIFFYIINQYINLLLHINTLVFLIYSKKITYNVQLSMKVDYKDIIFK